MKAFPNEWVIEKLGKFGGLPEKKVGMKRVKPSKIFSFHIIKKYKCFSMTINESIFISVYYKICYLKPSQTAWSFHKTQGLICILQEPINPVH